MPPANYDENVFINCPLDRAYKPIFEAIVFAIFDCGFVARCALEEDDGSSIRVQKIYYIISECRLGIHDLSKTRLDRITKLPRFNMPLELGAFLGAKYFGNMHQRRKACLILDSDEYRYQKFISDIAGQDIKAHADDPIKTIALIRNWLNDYIPRTRSIPSGSVLAHRYKLFRADLPDMCSNASQRVRELTYRDYLNMVWTWLKLHSHRLPSEDELVVD